MQKIIDFIALNLNKQSLEEMAVTIIAAYKHGDQSLLKMYAESLLGAAASAGKDKRALFFTLIKLIHPDRLPALWQDFKQAEAVKDLEKLKYLETLLSVRKKVVREKAARFDYTPEPEEYAYDETEFDEFTGAEERYDDSYDDEEDLSETVVEENRELSFMDAVRQFLFGNLDVDELVPFDLRQLEGSLDVSQYGLYELDGLEHCVNLTELNLSGNNLDNIYKLKYLTYLQELYLADNQISNLDYLAGLASLQLLDLENNEVEDIQVLLSLENLQLVNLKGNPLHLEPRNQDILKELKHRGVTVLV